MENRNLIEVEAVVEVPVDIDVETFSEHFSNWINSMEWNSCTIISPYNEG